MLRYLLEKEFKQMFRNSFLPRMLLLMPLMVMLVFPWAANQEVKNIQLSVVDNDHTATSEQLIQKLASSHYFRLSDYSSSNASALHSIERGDADLILEIEPHFERNLFRGEAGRVMVSTNAVNGTKANLGSSYLMSLLSDYSADLRQTHAAVTGASFTISPLYLFNPKLDYKVFMIPALMVMLLTMLSGFLPALNIVGEKESGTIEQINVTPVNRFLFIAAKLIPYWLIGFVVITICMGFAYLLYGLAPVGSLLTIYLFALVYILVVSGLGLVISNYSDTMQQAMFVMYFFVMILILMSGLFTPVTSMPLWAQHITDFNPLKYFMQVMRLVYLKGSSLSELMPQFLALLTFAVVLNTWAVLSYKKQ